MKSESPNMPINTIKHFPSDDKEVERLESQHNLLRKVFDDKLVLAPLTLTADAEVLDIGSGTGVWPLDFVSTYPNAEKARALCIDISSRFFPQHPPPNVTFQLGDILKQDAQEWESRFTFVHQRLLMFALTSEQWEEVIKKIYIVTAPGGWAQLLEGNLVNHSSDCGPATTRSISILKAQAQVSGVDLSCTLRLEELMKKAGFVDVQIILREIDLGASNGEIGTKFAETVMGAFRGLKDLTLRSGGFGLVRDEQDYDNVMDEMELEWKRPGTKVGWYVVIGRKAE